MGFGQSIVTPFASGIIGRHFNDTNRGIAFSVFNFGTYMSFSASLSLGSHMYYKYGWRLGYLLFGFIGLGIGVATPFLVTDGPTEDSESAKVDSSIKSVAYSNAIDTDRDHVCLLEGNKHSGNAVIENSSKEEGGLYGNHASGENMSLELSMMQTLSMVVNSWNRHGIAVYLLCLATGLRLGAGYVWVAYTAAFFSELWTTDSNDNGCQLSYNASYVGPDSDSMCDSSYPYCRGGDYLYSEQDSLYIYKGGECSSLNSMPWHNIGMAHSDLEMYMWWIPLLGSGLGSLIGGHLSDRLCKHLSSVGGRPLVAGCSCIASIPFVILALVSNFPACFLYFIPSGLVGVIASNMRCYIIDI
jgi:hypothetical protein